MVPYTTIELIGASLFLIAIIHTFSTKYFEHLAHVHKRFSGILHLLGEVEVVFGFWAMVLVLFIFGIEGGDSAVNMSILEILLSRCLYLSLWSLQQLAPFSSYQKKLFYFYQALFL